MTRLPLLIMAPLIPLGACASPSHSPQSVLANGQFLGTSDGISGTASLIELPSGVALKIDVDGLSPGTRALHLHSIGDCNSPDFKSAGGHLNPAGNQHGRLNPQGAHLGDLPNVEVPASGTVSQTIIIGPETAQIMMNIFDADGTAVVMHGGADDYLSDPAGAAGPRIACAVLELLGDS